MPSKTEAAVLFELGKPLRLIPLTIPSLQPGQVLVDVAYSGICHTQILEVDGKRGKDAYLPHTLGHEGSGIVREIGPGVTKVKPGDRVVLTWIKSQGKDVPKMQYPSAEGVINSGAISTFMRQTVISENRVVKIPGSMPLKEAALLGCAIPTGVGMILRTAKVQAGQSVALVGAGGIGLSALLGARLAGAGIIIALDILDEKLEFARKLGATHTINLRHEDAREAVKKITNGQGVDYALEAVGRRETMELAFEIVRIKGGLCILAGNLPYGERISIDPFDLIKGKQVIGTWGGETMPDEDIPRYAEHFLAGKLNLSALLTHEYALNEINEAFARIKEGKVSRAVIKM